MPIAEAQNKARELELDLVEIAPEAKPPVVKIIDFKKFKYLEDKKEKEARRHAKQTELKEVRFSPFIGQHDLETAINKTKKFLSEGDMVKISVVFTGRQMAHQEFGPKMLARVMSLLEGMANQEREPRFEGRRYVTIVKPTKEAIKQETGDKKQKADETKN